MIQGTVQRKVVITLALCLVLAACASIQGFVSPEISLVNLRFAEFSVLESTLQLEIRFSNVNPEPMTIDGGVFSLYLDGSRVGKGTTSETFEIPRLESVTQEFELHLSHLAMINRIRSIHQNKRVEYALKGELFVIRGTGTKRVKVAQEGDLDMQRDFGVGQAIEADESSVE